MPYDIKKRKCKQSSGMKGGYIVSYTDEKHKKHNNCHTSKSSAEKQIAAIEMKKESELIRMTIREMLKSDLEETTYNILTTATRNPYEDPGVEFELDKDDPVGLVKADRKINKELEIQGD